MTTHVVIDAANVIGSRPDGWWRDRAGAAQRLADRLAEALDAEVAGTGTPGSVVPGSVVPGGGVPGGGTPDSAVSDSAASDSAASGSAASDSGGSDSGGSDSGGSDSGLWGGDVTLHLVLEGAARRAAPVPHPRLRVVRAAQDGDGAIVEVVRELGGAGVLVVTADRALRERVHALGATTTGPATLLGALDTPGTAP